MKRFLVLLLISFLCLLPAQAQQYVEHFGIDNNTKVTSINPLPVTGGGVPLNLITSINGSIPSSATTITLAAPSTNVTVLTYGTTPATLYVNFRGSVATSADFAIPGGAGFTYEGVPISNFSILGASASGDYAVLAH